MGESLVVRLPEPKIIIFRVLGGIPVLGVGRVSGTHIDKKRNEMASSLGIPLQGLYNAKLQHGEVIYSSQEWGVGLWDYIDLLQINGYGYLDGFFRIIRGRKKSRNLFFFTLKKGCKENIPPAVQQFFFGNTFSKATAVVHNVENQRVVTWIINNPSPKENLKGDEKFVDVYF